MIGMALCTFRHACPGCTRRVSTTKQQHAPGDAGAPRDPYRQTVADDVLDSYGDRVTLQTVRGHASAHTPTSDDRHGARATQQAVGMVHAGSKVVLIEANRICR